LISFFVASAVDAASGAPTSLTISNIRERSVPARPIAPNGGIGGKPFYEDHVDLRVAGPLPIVVRRNYDSRNTATNEFGYGWLSGYPSYLIPSSDLSTINAADSDGSVVLFRRQGTMDLWLLTCADNPDLISGRGGADNLFNSSIVRTISSDGVTRYQWRLGDGSIRNYVVRQFPITIGGVNNPNEGVYLDTIVDNRGNSLAFTYGTLVAENDYSMLDRIQSSNGGSVRFSYNPARFITRAAAADGRTVKYTYDGEMLSKVQMPDGGWIAYDYDPDIKGDLLTQETKPDGRILRNAYDSARHLVAQMATLDPTRPGVAVTKVTYDYRVPGRTTIKDAYDNPTVEETDGSVTKITDPLGHTIIRTFYSTTDPAVGAYQLSLESETDQRGLVTTYRYDARGNPTQTTVSGDLDGDPATIETATTTAVYDHMNRLTAFTNASGITTEYAYAAPGFPYLRTQIVTKRNGGTLRTDKLEYTSVGSSKGLLARQTRALGTPDQAVTEYGYNAAGLVIRLTAYTGTADPNVVATFGYNARGEVTSITDADGRSTVYTYDGLSRPTSKTVKDENGAILGLWTTPYNANGEIAEMTGPRTHPANSVRRYYDGAGRLQREVVTRSEAKADGNGVQAATSATTTYVHDLRGNVVETIDPLGNETVFTYDAGGNLLTKTTAGFRTESFQYELGGNVSQYTNPLGGITRKYYTATGKLRRQEDPDGSSQEWRYYTDGRLQKEILRNGSYWEIVYDDIARTVIRMLRRSDGTALATEVSAYDLRGNLVSHTDVEGHVTTVTYDGLDRIKTISGPAATASSGRQCVTIFYGASTKTRQMQNSLGETVAIASDALGRPVRIEIKDATGTVVRATGYAYSADHNAVTVSEGSGMGAIAQTTYTDTAGHVVLVASGDGQFTRNSYDARGNLLSTTNALNNTNAYAYDPFDQVVSQTLPDGTVTRFTHDAAGDLLTSGVASGALVYEWAYDDARRLVTMRLYSGNAYTRRSDYAYYPAGTPWAGLLQTLTAPRCTTTTTYDDSLHPKTVISSGSSPETNETTNYTYDRRGRVIAVSQRFDSDAAGPATQVSRTYDGYGQLLTETVMVADQTFSGVTQTWDAAGRRASLNVAGSTLAAPLFTYRYRADGLLAQVTANQQDYSFGYTDSGMLTKSISPFRTLTIDARDAAGRILRRTTTVRGSPAMTEAMAWRIDGTLDTYTVTRSGGGTRSEARVYRCDARGQPVSDQQAPAVGEKTALTNALDDGFPLLEVRTDAKAEDVDVFADDNAPDWERNRARADSIGARSADQRLPPDPQPPSADAFGGRDNRVARGLQRILRSYRDQQDVIAILGLAEQSPEKKLNFRRARKIQRVLSPQFMAANGNGGDQGDRIKSTDDADGRVVSRTWESGRMQTLTWDAFGRLNKVVQRDRAGDGYDWSAVYDGLGRRLKTTKQPVSAGAPRGQATVTTSVYDPQVESLEIGIAANGTKTWQVYGPDLSVRSGALRGMGELEAIILDPDRVTKGVVTDQFGDVVAVIFDGSISWVTQSGNQ
jgi:YD repeat-containing protein